MPRLYREAPLNSIWEGSGNVICLDVMRALRKEPETATAFMAELRLARGGDARFDRYLADLEADLPKIDEFAARRLTERLAVALEAALMIRHADSACADAFSATRLADDWGCTFGTLPASANVDRILAASVECESPALASATRQS